MSFEKENILSHLKIYLTLCFWNNFDSFKNFTDPFLIFENEQFLNLVKFCEVNNWKLYKVYIWASPIFKVFISLNHWLCKIFAGYENCFIFRNQKMSVNFLNKRNYFKSTVSDKFWGGTKYFFSKVKIIWNLAQIWAKYPRKIDHKVWDYFNIKGQKQNCVCS